MHFGCSVYLLRKSRPDRAATALGSWRCLLLIELSDESSKLRTEARRICRRLSVAPWFEASENLRVVVVWGSHMLCAFAAAAIALVPQLPAHRVTGYASGISRTSDVQMINLFGNTGAQNHATAPCDDAGLCA